MYYINSTSILSKKESGADLLSEKLSFWINYTDYMRLLVGNTIWYGLSRPEIAFPSNYSNTGKYEKKCFQIPLNETPYRRRNE